MVLFAVSFIAGVLTVLAPCVLPLLPVTLGGAMAEAGNRRRPLVIIGSLAVSVFIFTLLLKGSTALLGTSPTFWSYVSAIILIAFGLTLLFPITWAKIVLKLPGHNKPESWMAKGYQSRSHWWGDILVGAALGPVFTTCSPTFFVILATVLPQSLGLGIIDLLAYIVGLSLSLLLIAYIGQKLVGKLDWAIDPNGWFRKALGVLFIVVAVVIVFGWDKQIEAKILNSGFFDVTTLEQNIHQSLEGPKSYKEPVAGSQELGAGSLKLGETQSQSSVSSTSQLQAPSSKLQASAANQISHANLPPPPVEQNEGRYVEIADPAGFVNSAPFKLADFIGKKVILVDFIDYTCINCERTFPYLENWWDKYNDQGLEVVAIHTPEFAFEKDISNVTAGAKQFGLTFPIVLDNGYATWNAYGNEYWPHKYFIDIHGDIVYDKIGEGGDNVVEAEIVKLLNDRLRFLGQNAAVNTGTSTMPDYTIQTESPETYFGAMRNEYFGNGTLSIAGDDSYTTPNQLTPNKFYLGGSWHIDQEYAETKSAGDTLSYEFTATNMYIIATTADGTPAIATILIDGHSIPSTWEGSDVVNGKVTINASRLYHLYSNPTLGQHRIDVIFDKPGTRVYTFTFG